MTQVDATAGREGWIAPGAERSAMAVAAAGVLLVVAIYAPTFASMVAIWNRDATFRHCYVIPLLSGWLFWRARHSIAAANVRPSLLALPVCAVLVLIWLAADITDIQVLRQGAAMALIPGAIWAIVGPDLVRRAAFPLGYLALAVPFGDALVPSLIEFTTNFIIAGVRLVGVPIYRDGAVLSLPSGDFEVIKACSGIRYLIASVALGTLFAGLRLRTWPRRLLFIALTVAVPIVANGVRAFLIVMIAHLSGMRYAVGIDHLVYGWVFFGLVMALVFWIGSKFAQPPSGPTHEGRALVGSAFWSPATWQSYAMLAGVLVVLAAGPVVAGRLQTVMSVDAAASATAALPLSADGWLGPLSVIDPWTPAFALGPEVRQGRYESREGAVSLYERRYVSEVEGGHQLAAASLLPEENGDWYLLLDSRDMQVQGNRFSTSTIAGRAGQRYRVWMWFIVDGQPAATPWRAKLLELRALAQLRRPAATSIALVTAATSQDSPDELLKQFVTSHELLTASSLRAD